MMKAIVAIILLLGLGSPDKEPPQPASEPPEQALESPEQVSPEESRRERIWKMLQQLPPPEEFRGERLEVPFEILDGGALVMALDRRTPASIIVGVRALYLVLPNEVVRLDSLAQLRGRVEIGSAQQALAFCRLLTSPRTYDLWWPARKRRELEILSADQVDSELLFGEYWSSGYLDYLRREAAGYRGIVSSRQKLEEMGIGPTHVRTIAEGYEIRRALMVWDFDMNRKQMEKVVEVVGHDGSYVRRESHAQDLPAGVSWRFPHFM